MDASTTSSSVNLCNYTAATVDNLAEEVDECPLNWGRKVLLTYNWDRENSVIWSSGVFVIQGLLKY